MSVSLDSPIAALRHAAEAKDADAFAACLSADVMLRSPITGSFGFHGREQVAVLMRDVFAVFEDLRYTADIGDARQRLLRASARVRGQEVHEAVFVTLDDDGLVTEMEVFVRPLPGLTAMAAGLAPRVARRRGRRPAIAARAMLAPLAVATRAGDRAAARLAAPARWDQRRRRKA